jgi:hypothetical protein
LENLVDFEEEG